MQTVCLVIPPSPFLLDERVFPFLGILKVAAALENAGYPVEVLDLSGYSNYLDIVQDYASASSARSFGITATTPQFPAAVAIASTIREARDDARLILGGTHATLVVAAQKYEQKHGRTGRAHRAYRQLEKCFDVIVSGDGEHTIFSALSLSTPKLVDADDRHSPSFLNDERLEATPYPARHLIELESYRYQVDGASATSLIAQLGCPFECGFCAGRKSPMLRHIRTRSTQSIVDEMTQLYRTYGYRGFMFYDDELNVSRTMVELMESIASRQRELGVEWRLRGFIKAELFTEAQAQVMREAGFRQILVGFESGSPRILENIKKKATQEDNTRCVEIAHRHDLKVKALMSLGHPGESRETAEETRRWIMDVHPSDFDVSIITPYPGSPYYDEAAPGENGVWIYRSRNGDALYQEEVNYADVADYYKGNPDDGYVSHVWTDHLAAAELVLERDHIERSCREVLGIPFNPSAVSVLYEHSMGQSWLPGRLLRRTGEP